MASRIAWVEEGEATGPIADHYARARADDGYVADILKTFSGHPKALEGMLAFSEVHFAPGEALTRAQREMIATHVSVVVGCHY